MIYYMIIVDLLFGEAVVHGKKAKKQKHEK